MLTYFDYLLTFRKCQLEKRHKTVCVRVWGGLLREEWMERRQEKPSRLLWCSSMLLLVWDP